MKRIDPVAFCLARDGTSAIAIFEFEGADSIVPGVPIGNGLNTSLSSGEEEWTQQLFTVCGGDLDALAVSHSRFGQ